MKKKAFTLLELIAAVSILSVLILIPILRINFIGHVGFKNEFETFKNDYSFARQRALASGDDYNLYFKGASYYLGENYYDKPSDYDFKRDLKYMKADKNYRINFKENGYVRANENNSDKYTMVFTSLKDKSLTKRVTIAAIGGRISEK